jgi:hypothetical protein
MVEEFLSRKIFHQMIKSERLQKRNNHCLRVINIYGDFSEAEVGQAQGPTLLRDNSTIINSP